MWHVLIKVYWSQEPATSLLKKFSGKNNTIEIFPLLINIIIIALVLNNGEYMHQEEDPMEWD